MEGPTPVSSLIHAATMVTAGIFLILRMSDFFALITNSISIIIVIGSITLFFASSIGITQTDIKKIIAYSTCSQLGYMFLSCGFQNYANGMYHLFIHAFFKALLFLTAGYLIHLLSSEQDIRKMGGVLKILPFSYAMMLVGSYSLVGLPFLSGFYSKDPLIENIIIIYYNSFFFSKNVITSVALVLALMTVLITALYSIKSIIDIYYVSFRGFRSYIENVHSNTSLDMHIPLSILCFATIYSGYLFQDSFIGLNSDFLSSSMYFSKSSTHYVFDIGYSNTFFLNENHSSIGEFYPYYRFYLIHLLLYTLFIFIIIKI
jgi:NADH:ubiquinone oxidoreductase subunit 5 (subunit L)/multisubunit Na+/H+ antiporter MnhA subunit